LLDQRSPSTHVFNCVSDESYSVLEVAEKVARLWKEVRPNAPDLRIRLVANPRSSVEILDPEFHATRELTQNLLGITCQRAVEETLRSLLAR
jgi:nucleoside-diphosphate-sugar epimerase